MDKGVPGRSCGKSNCYSSESAVMRSAVVCRNGHEIEILNAEENRHES